VQQLPDSSLVCVLLTGVQVHWSTFNFCRCFN